MEKVIGIIVLLFSIVALILYFKAKKCSHESTEWVGRGGLENVGIQARVCETCGKEIEARAVYCDDKGNILSTRKM